MDMSYSNIGTHVCCNTTFVEFNKAPIVCASKMTKTKPQKESFSTSLTHSVALLVQFSMIFEFGLNIFRQKIREM